MTTVAKFFYSDPSSYAGRPWSKVDGGGQNYQLQAVEKTVQDIAGREKEFGVDVSGFQVIESPAQEKDFDDDARITTKYYAEVEELLRTHLKGVKKVVIFDHTIRKRVDNAARKPVRAVHVDQTQKAAEARVRRHVTGDDTEELIRGRFQIINVWRPIGHEAADFPLAVADFRSTKKEDFVEVDLLYPKRAEGEDNDDRGKERLPTEINNGTSEGYEVKGETFGVVDSAEHRWYYERNMRPDQVMLLKCFDSRGEGVEGGWKGIARCTPHTAFEDPLTPTDAKPRQSIEVRTLVFYE